MGPASWMRRCSRWVPPQIHVPEALAVPQHPCPGSEGSGEGGGTRLLWLVEAPVALGAAFCPCGLSLSPWGALVPLPTFLPAANVRGHGQRGSIEAARRVGLPPPILSPAGRQGCLCSLATLCTLHPAKGVSTLAALSHPRTGWLLQGQGWPQAPALARMSGCVWAPDWLGVQILGGEGRKTTSSCSPLLLCHRVMSSSC